MREVRFSESDPVMLGVGLRMSHNDCAIKMKYTARNLEAISQMYASNNERPDESRVERLRRLHCE